MKKTKMMHFALIVGIIAIVAMIGFGFTACGGDDGTGGCDEECLAIGETGEGGGIIFYHKHSGFTVTGTDSFTAYYLEAAPFQGQYIWTWASSDFEETDIPGTKTAIGTGKNNTALILASDPAAPAAKECADYENGGKSDWFLPSKDELYEMFKARNHFDNLVEVNIWSSSQSNYEGGAYCMYFKQVGGEQIGPAKGCELHVCAIRAF